MILLVIALCIRIFAIPGSNMCRAGCRCSLNRWSACSTDWPRAAARGATAFWEHIYSRRAYIFFSTLFELFGFQVIATSGHSVALPAPLSDINAAIMLGVLSYFIIVSGAIAGNGIRGIGKALTEVSLLISMSFRLFGALLSGMLVTELVYYYAALSFGIPVIVAVMFTLLHALIQSYVLTMLTALFYGEMSEPSHKEPRRRRAQSRCRLLKKERLR